jgi:hypothetical protein
MEQFELDSRVISQKHRRHSPRKKMSNSLEQFKFSNLFLRCLSRFFHSFIIKTTKTTSAIWAGKKNKIVKSKTGNEFAVESHCRLFVFLFPMIAIEALLVVCL